MSSSYIHPFIQVQESPKRGRGVFAIQDIEEGTLIEVSPVIRLSASDTQAIHQTILHDYYFLWGDKQNESAIALGYISLYNHSEKANCLHECDFNKNLISIITTKPVKAGEELFINYNLDEEKPLWFKII